MANLEPSSAEAYVTITEALPITIIDDFQVPNSLSAGNYVAVRILLRNAGALGRLDWYIDGNPIDPDSEILVAAGRTPTAVSPGESVWIDVLNIAFPMPAWDFTLIASNEDGSSYISKTITLVEAGIPTTLTIIAPASVPQDEIFNVVGLLLRTDINAPVPGAMINISYNGVDLGNIFTDDLGRYLLTTSIETSGTYTLKATFAGSSVFASSSTTTRIKTLSKGITMPLIEIVIGVYLVLKD